MLDLEVLAVIMGDSINSAVTLSIFEVVLRLGLDTRSS